MDHTGGYLCYLPSKAAKLTIACCVLHNICRKNNIPLLSRDLIAPLVCETENNVSVAVGGNEQRNRIISMFD